MCLASNITLWDKEGILAADSFKNSSLSLKIKPLPVFRLHFPQLYRFFKKKNHDGIHDFLYLQNLQFLSNLFSY